MDFSKINEVKAPIIYIGATLFFSSIFYLSLDYGLEYSFILSSIFFIFIYLKCDKEFLLIVVLTFFIGLFINYNFYNFKFINGEEVKITKIYNYGGRGEIRGRNVFLKGDLKEFSFLDRVNISGEFIKKIDKEYGNVGEIIINNVEKNNSFINKFNIYRNEFMNYLEEKIGKRDLGIIASILFGYKEELENDDMNEIKRFGIVHVMSISGLHIGIIFLVLKKIFKEEVGLIGALIYVFLTGASFSSIRAIIMLSLIYISFKVRKNNNSLASLFFSLIIIFLFKPYGVISIGFLLSFFATLGIILFYKPIRKKLYKIGGSIGDTISISLSAQVFVLPILIYYFNEFSTTFIIGNIILVPIINLILILGFLSFLIFKIPLMIDVVLFFIGTLIYFLDFLLELLDKFSPELLYIGEYYGLFYFSLFITYYFYKKGIKNIIVLPLASIFFIGINLYSPFPKIRNIKDGLVISYKGENIGFLNEKGDYDKVKSVYNTKDNYSDFYKVNIKENCEIKNNNGKFILDLGNKDFLLNLEEDKCDNVNVINFKDEKIKEIILIDKKIIKIK